MIVQERAVEKMDVGGSQLQFLATPDQIGKEGYSVMLGTLPSHGIVPLHSHADPEMFYVIRGGMECYQGSGSDSGWRQVSSGSLAVIAGAVKHAWRNPTDIDCVCVVFTGSDVCHFLQELARPVSQVAGSEQSQSMGETMIALAKQYGHWLGSPEENREIGLQLS